jgi:hypothetical protein
MCGEIFERLRHEYERRTQCYKKKAGEDKQYKWEDQFYGGLRRLFLHCLNALGSECLGMSA